MNVVPRAVRVLAVLGAVSWIGGDAFLVKKNILRPTARTQSTTVRAKEGATDTDGIGSPKAMFFGTVAEKSSVASQSEAKEQRRVLGSQELLMLPRQYGPNADVRFPQMNHVSCTVLSATPSEEIMRQAIDAAIQAHPLLYCRVEGDGEPDERIDLFKMVRKGDPNPCTFVSTPGSISVDDVLTVVNVDGSDSAAFEKSWSGGFARNLDDGSWCHTEKGPLWKIEWHRTHGGGDGPCALILAFNHAISDQSSANKLTDQIIRNAADLEEKGATKPAVKHIIPLAVEDSVMGKEQRWNDVQTDGLSLQTAGYVAGKASEGFKSPVILPDTEVKKDAGNPLGALSIISGQAAGGEDEESDKRRSTLQFRSLSTEATTALLERCREKKISVTNALTAAVTLTSTDFIDNGTETKQRRNYKVLQSLDMRRFGEQLDGGDTVACMAGSMDLLHGPLPDRSGQKLRRNPTKESLVDFWNLAGEGKKQTEDFIASDGPQNAVRVFDFAMSISDMNNLVHLTSQSKDSKGRAYSAGVTNVGVFDRQPAFQREGESEQTPLKVMHGRFKVEDIFFATSHARTGCLYQVSCLTVGGELKMTFHPASPIISEETNARFANAFVDLLEIVAGVKDASSEEDIDDQMNSAPPLSENALPIATAVVGAAAVASHAQAYSAFFSSVMQMKDNIADPSDFWGALNFWVFFAVGHPILEPILAISDVLHGSPGPKVADLVPVTFLLGNLIVLGTIALSKEVRTAVNIAAVAVFFAYVGAGLDGTAGLGDFNLALDDSYKGQIVRGCPTYDEVRQPSMDKFNLEKYQGKWYEHKFHDWTQFKEVYDTTLSIKLTADGNGWIDDFAVKGPAPDAAPLSWDKSPVANGAHYFLFGRVDKNDPSGVLRESGFGVEFPNYIVDVKKDPQTGEYKEAIQFQCLERGGVRVFEGINFMSRNPTMSQEELEAMHSRAEKAGMYPYGASPEQMHTVARRPEGAPAIDNTWQAMWRSIGVDRLLELLTESIEDGGR